jgi:hypothetical protein
MFPASMPAETSAGGGCGCPRPDRRRVGAQEQEQAVELRPGRPAEPPLPEQHPLRADRPRCRLGPGQDRGRPRGPLDQRHAGQLLRRNHPVGHHPLGRGKLQRLLSFLRARPPRTSATASPTRPRRGSGSWTIPASTPRNAGYENETNRFGWIVEVDPFDPTSTPKKHSSLGRFKHEGANVIVAKSGHVVAYMGDDERFDYLYKFVSKAKYREGDRKHNMTLLSEGDLYVAKFTGNAPAAEITARAPFLRTAPSTAPANGCPWWSAASPWWPACPSRKCWCTPAWPRTRWAPPRWTAARTSSPACTPARSTSRAPTTRTAASRQGRRHRGQPAQREPRRPHRRNHGDRRPDLHQVQLEPADGLRRSLHRRRHLLLRLPGRPGLADFLPGQPGLRLRGQPLDLHRRRPLRHRQGDGLFKVTLDGPERGRVEQFLAVPRDAETCGPIVHDTEGSVFVSVQHPGEEGTFEAPHSYFPDYVAAGTTPRPGQVRAPRPAVVQVFRS